MKLKFQRQNQLTDSSSAECSITGNAISLLFIPIEVISPPDSSMALRVYNLHSFALGQKHQIPCKGVSVEMVTLSQTRYERVKLFIFSISFQDNYLVFNFDPVLIKEYSTEPIGKFFQYCFKMNKTKLSVVHCF